MSNINEKKTIKNKQCLAKTETGAAISGYSTSYSGINLDKTCGRIDKKSKPLSAKSELSAETKNGKKADLKKREKIPTQKKGAKAVDKSFRSDMASELAGHPSAAFSAAGEIIKSRIDVNKTLSKKIGKPEGVYLTLETGIVTTGLTSRYHELSEAVCGGIRQLVPGAKNVLVVCLGNPGLTADALGSRVFDNLVITRHLPEELKPKASIAALCPNVMGATGIESFDIIKGVIERIKPQLVIAVDSLASAAVGRIASAFQICSSGITPGSGVANHRIRLDKSSLGVDVISIGVPLVVYATTIIAEAAGAQAIKNLGEEMTNLIVTPKDIDLLVEECAKVIAAGINKAFVE